VYFDDRLQSGGLNSYVRSVEMTTQATFSSDERDALRAAAHSYVNASSVVGRLDSTELNRRRSAAVTSTLRALKDQVSARTLNSVDLFVHTSVKHNMKILK
jgi:hypothetical protein